MLPTSIAGSIRILAPPTVSPSTTVRTSARSNAEVAAGHDAAQVQVRAVGAGHVAARRDRLVEQDRHLRPDRTDEPGRSEALLDLLGGRGPERRVQRRCAT